MTLLTPSNKVWISAPCPAVALQISSHLLTGSKLAAYHKLLIPGNTTATLKMRFYSVDEAPLETFGSSFDEIFAQRMAEKDEFYRARLPVGLSSGKLLTPILLTLLLLIYSEIDEYNLMIQAYAGLLHTKQFYHYTIRGPSALHIFKLS